LFGKGSNKDVSNEKLDTVIGSGAGFTGSLKVEGTMRVDGRVNGEIEVQGDIIVGKSAVVKAVIKGRNATVAGEVHGDVFLEGKLELDRTGKVFGDIEVSKLIVHEGGVFRGESKMSSDSPGNVNNNQVRNTEAREDVKGNKKAVV
jgi:cytoskeletal protein CcmA (bactofilin family)